VSNKTKSAAVHAFPKDVESYTKSLGKKELLSALDEMLRIRNFEIRAESAYQQGKIGGFFHSYIGQEAIQTACMHALGTEHWWVASYRCHALALLLGESPESLMAELYGRANGNAQGRGGSMHLYSERLLGGFGIVGGQCPIAIGAAFTVKYRKEKGPIALCFLGDGAVAQGAFHESLNLAALWDLPCLFVIENNQWGMGTAVDRAISVERIAEAKAPGYGLKGYTLDGMDYLACYAGFKQVYEEMQDSGRPIVLEVVTERFRGHSISDPGLYRSKDELKKCTERDPIHLLKDLLIQRGMLDEESFKAMDKAQREIMIAAMKYADESPWPDPVLLEEDVYAP
jgi:pyruvate dehydrogenase E1 component alpha subunit